MGGLTPLLPGMEREARDPALSQWFTEPRLASRVWDWANRYTKPRTVLEPSAGQGALIHPMIDRSYECKVVTAVDIDPVNCDVLRQRFSHNVVDVVCADFLSIDWGDRRFDLSHCNTPYEDGQAEEFIMRSLDVCARVVGIFKASIQHGQERHRTLWQHAVVTREVKLMSRPSFGVSAEGNTGGKTDFVVLEMIRTGTGKMPAERMVMQEMWP